MIPKRLLALADFIGESDVVADIGSDHGLLPLLLVKAGHPYVYASENKEGPFLRLKEETKEAREAIEVALADGIERLPENITTVVIAGMGGGLIKRILLKHRANLAKVKKIILAPHGSEEAVRLTLKNLKFKITREKVIKENGHYYEIIGAERTKEKITITFFETLFGPLNLQERSAEFIAKWEEVYAHNEKILENPNIDNIKWTMVNETQIIINYVLTGELNGNKKTIK